MNCGATRRYALSSIGDTAIGRVDWLDEMAASTSTNRKAPIQVSRRRAFGSAMVNATTAGRMKKLRAKNAIPTLGSMVAVSGLGTRPALANDALPPNA